MQGGILQHSTVVVVKRSIKVVLPSSSFGHACLHQTVYTIRISLPLQKRNNIPLSGVRWCYGRVQCIVNKG